MRNSYFRFKQFTIWQDRCAMKVCTDSCLFGASIKIPNEGNILDIGTGTGLLSLMAAQRSEANIIAIEIDKKSADQALENFSQSSFNNQITIINDDAINYANNNEIKFDCIISNPPFFENHLLSQSHVEATAKHAITLSHIDLLKAVHQLLKVDGNFYVLLPYSVAHSFIEKAKSFGLKISENVSIKNRFHSDPFRSILNFNYHSSETISTEIIIYESVNKYSEQAIGILKPFYFYL